MRRIEEAENNIPPYPPSKPFLKYFFEPEEIEVLTNLNDQALITIENVLYYFLPMREHLKSNFHCRFINEHQGDR